MPKNENAKKLDLLKKYLEEGYLLHGGKEKLAIIEPRQATDDQPERKTGKANAIYAEKHDVRVPILMALFAKKDHSLRDMHSSYSGHGPDSLMAVTGENCTFTNGYVHVLSVDSFEIEENDDDSEYISRSPVTPIDVIEVTPDILDEFENITFDLK